MEKYLRLLNPKTTNFDAIGGGNHGALSGQDVCIALSYAKLTPLQDNLVRIKCLGANSIKNIELLSEAVSAKYRSQLEAENISREYHVPVIRAALIEFCMVPATYKPSVRSRAVFVGVNYMVVHRYLNSSISRLVEDFQREFAVASDKIIFQLSKTK